MRGQKKPIIYGKPCLTNLPPELGRRIFNTIINTPPFDRTKMERECARAEHRLNQIIAELDRNEVAAK